MRKDFCAFILSHGRANNVKTLNTLLRYGYTGDYYIIIDNEDNQSDLYIQNFGRDKIIIFDKLESAKNIDACDLENDRRTIIYARNECFNIAKKLGYKYFIELDDDYYYFGIRTKDGAKKARNLDLIFESVLEYYENTNITTIAFSQGGDHIGGFNDNVKIKRKAMNSFICSTDRPFKFLGRINEDVNTYVNLGQKGELFLQINMLQLDQDDTQKNKNGMTEVYKANGTYLKSFYSVLTNPSCVKVGIMSSNNKRIHHIIQWSNVTPMIISEDYKKK